MKECFDYQASPRLDMIFNIHIKEIIQFFYLLLSFLERIKVYEIIFFIKINGIPNKRKEKD